MNIPCAWTLTNGDPSISVAIVDQYLDDFHDDLLGKIVEIVYPSDCRPDEADNHHGIQSMGAVAGIRNNGICITGSGGETTVAGFCRCANDAVLQEVFDRGYRIVSISCWSGMSREKLVELTEQGMTVLLAGLDQYHWDYQDVPGVIHVGRAYQSGQFWQYGTLPNQNLDVLVVTQGLKKIGEANSCDWSGAGTSIGTPYLAGVVALMKSVNPCLRPFEIEHIIKVTAADAPSNAPPGTTERGVIDAYAAVSMAKNYSGPGQRFSGTLNIIGDEYYSGRIEFLEGVNSVQGDLEIGANSTVTVHSGATLGVIGSIGFGQNAKVIVKRGGRMVVDDGLLTKLDCAEFWTGVIIEGNARIAQDDSSVPQNLKAGKMTVKNGAVIEHAKYAVSMNPLHLPWPNHYYYGGLINASNSTFRNNQKAVGFMKYYHDDLSSFTNVTFENHQTATSHWANHGVVYDGCTFTDYANRAILGIDAAITVANGCSFDNAGHLSPDKSAIHLMHSIANRHASKIGVDGTTSNQFSGGYHSIHYSSGANMEAAEFSNNVFLGGRIPLRMEGHSEYRIFENDFIGPTHTGTYLISSGGVPKRQFDNQFSNCPVSIHGFFDNLGYTFTSNCFDGGQYSDFQLSGEINNLGKISPNQGNARLAASNLFSESLSTNNRRISVNLDNQTGLPNQIEVFRYHLLENQPPAGREYPFGYAGNINDATGFFNDLCGSNQTPGPINVSEFECTIPANVGEIESFVASLEFALSEKELVLALFEQYTTEWYAIMYDITQIKDCLYRAKNKLVMLRGSARQYTELIAFFNTDRFTEKLKVYSIMVENEDYTDARSYLNQMAPVGEDEVDFVNAQHINLDWHEQENFSLSPLDSISLRTMGDKPFPLSGFARSIFYNITDEYIFIDLPDEESIMQSSISEDQFGDLVSQTEDVISVYPNPTTQNLHVLLTGDIFVSHDLQIYSSDGRQIYQFKHLMPGQTHNIDVDDWESGIYIVKIYKRDGQELIDTKKVIKQ